MRRRPLLRALLLLLLASCVACSGPSAKGRPPGALGKVRTDGQAGPRVGNIALVEDIHEDGQAKVIVGAFVFGRDDVTPAAVNIDFGSAPMVPSDARELTVDLIDERGGVLAVHGFRNPRKVVVERQGLVEQPTVLYAVRFPFSRRATAMRVFDGGGRLLATLEVQHAIELFCRSRRQDAGCSPS
jgi:hypothetical protein